MMTHLKLLVFPVQIYYNKYSSMSFGNFKKLITEYIDTYVETYT